MNIAKRRGQKKAIVALARRLAVIMHRMWSARGGGPKGSATACIGNGRVSSKGRLSGALLDRLTHHVHILELRRELPAETVEGAMPVGFIYEWRKGALEWD